MVFTKASIHIHIYTCKLRSRVAIATLNHHHIRITFANYAITLALGKFTFVIPVSNFAILHSQRSYF